MAIVECAQPDQPEEPGPRRHTARASGSDERDERHSNRSDDRSGGRARHVEILRPALDEDMEHGREADGDER